MNSDQYSTRVGIRDPHGVKADTGGANFSIFSRHATSVELLLFSAADSAAPFQTIQLDPEKNQTFFAWHVYVEDLPVGTWYAWRIDGPGNTRTTGHRFDPDKVLLDPWARAITLSSWDRAAACLPGDNLQTSMRAMVCDESYDWEDDTPLNIPNENAIIYELHVGGFTRHASSSVNHPGTFNGLIEKIPYLQELGITHVELMPVMAYDEQDVPPATTALGLKNYWGYSTHSFFCPHPSYCTTPEQGSHLREFRDLVKALHRAGIGIILDVVFNHTAEAGVDGPTISFKGIGSSIFYQLDEQDRRVFRDYTGCGNTVNCNHPLVANFIISCLEYWVREMHVDGFRFDLASALSRGEDGKPLRDPPVLWGIELSNQLARSRLIAEAWDAAGLYQVGSFPGYRWAEWNGRYRDIVRRYLRGDRGMIAELATRLSGSADLYKQHNRLPINSINFVTCHDGFTLIDLFSYKHKHNKANGEGNRDGHNGNLSFNCGIEGDTTDPAILMLRRQLARNAVAILLLSQGVPMLLSGDEVLNTQKGNNNSYCQDNELAWFDWTLIDNNADMLLFVRGMIALRKRHPSLMRRRFLTGKPANGRELPDIRWYGQGMNEPKWNEADSQLLRFTLAAVEENEADLHVILNLSTELLNPELPPIQGARWHLCVDTALPSPRDMFMPDSAAAVTTSHYPSRKQSVVVLESRLL